VAVTTDVEARRVPEEIRLGPVVEGDLGRNVEADRLRELLAPLRVPAVLRGQPCGSVCAVLLETLASVEFLDETDVVQERGHVQKLRVEPHPVALRERDGEEVAAKTVVGEERRCDGAHELLGLPRETGARPDRQDVGVHGAHCASLGDFLDSSLPVEASIAKES
jgi:hypothetical protein